MTTSLQLLFQIAPSGLWGEAMHVSGLFATIVRGLEEDKVQVPPCSSSWIKDTDLIHVHAAAYDSAH